MLHRPASLRTAVDIPQSPDRPLTAQNPWQGTVGVFWPYISWSCLFVLRSRFAPNKSRLFSHYDGNDNYVLLLTEETWMPVGITWCATPFQALGNVFLGSNFHVSPSAKLTMLLRNGQADRILIYTILAVETFLAMVLICRLLGVPATAGCAAAWLITLLFLPYSPNMLALPNTYQSPQLMEIILLWCLGVTMFWEIGRHGVVRSLACSVLSLVFVLWAIALQPAGQYWSCRSA